MNRRKSLISILFITAMMMNLAVIPAFAGKTEPVLAAHASLQQPWSDIPEHFEVYIYNDGNVPITLIHITVTGTTVDSWGYEKGWSLSYSLAYDATFKAKGGTIRSGESTQVSFSVTNLAGFSNVHWQAYDRKSNLVGQGDLPFTS